MIIIWIKVAWMIIINLMHMHSCNLNLTNDISDDNFINYSMWIANHYLEIIVYSFGIATQIGLEHVYDIILDLK